MKRKIINIFLLAFILRFVVALLGEHGDVINYYWWAKDLWARGFLGFYERSIANAMRPTYPPITSYIFWGSAALHKLIWNISWFLNIKITFFPSNFIFWLESAKGWYFVNKIPAILADIGIISLLYAFVKDLKNEKLAIIAASFFAFLPPFWYNSSLWGQTDSIFALPMLGAFYALHKDRKVLSAFLYGVAVLVKPTALFAFPVFALWWFKKTKVSDYFWSMAVVFTTVVLVYLPFHPENTIPWIISFYQNSLGGELNYIVANSFNFWGLIYGFGNIPETVSFLGLSSHTIGYCIFAFFFAGVFLFFRTQKKTNTKMIIFLAVLTSFFAFLILPRMHERYFYPTLLLLVPLAALDTKLRKVFFILSGIHFINLYHFWWVPRVEVLIEILSNRLVEQSIIILNILMFAWLVLIFKRHYAKTKR